MSTLFGISRELMGVLSAGALLPACLHSMGEATDEGHGQPIMFIPGFGGSDWSLDVLRMRLTQRGFKTNPSGIRNSGNYKKHSEHLLSRLQAIADETGQSVALVGHSMGGRFACHLADEAPSLVRSIVMMGTPIEKRQMPALVSILQLDALCAEMGSRCHLPTATPLTVIVGELDQIVSVSEAELSKTELRARYREQVLVPTDHLGLPYATSIPALVAKGVLKTRKSAIH